MLNFLALQDVLPENSISFAGGVVRIEVANLVGNAVDLETSVLECYGRLLQGFHELQALENAARANQNPPKMPLNLLIKGVGMSANANPMLSYSLSLETDTANTFDAVIDPSV